MQRLSLFLFLFITQVALSQVRIQNLFFNSTSNILQLNFNSTPPGVTYTGTASGTDIGEGIAHVEDPDGNIIIWVNASGVYDKNGSLMPGSVGIMAHPSSTEIVICPVPADANRFYVFYNNETCSGLYYATVDLRQRGGLGDVTAKNVPIDPGNAFAEGLEIVKIPCSSDYWLLAYQCTTGFKRFRIGPAGVGVGTFIHPFQAKGPNNREYGGRGELDYHNGKIGYGVRGDNRAVLAEFDPVTGAMTGVQEVAFAATDGMYGLEFSPDATKVYLTDWNNRDFLGNVTSPNLFRYDFATGAIASWTIPYNTTNCRNAEVEGLGQVELGQDGKLYIPHVNGCQITVVENPNAAAPAFGVINVNAILSTGVSDHIQSEVLGQPLRLQASRPTVCPGESVTLTASGGSGNYTWEPVPGGIPPAGNAVEVHPASTTTYTLYATTPYGCRDTVRVTVAVASPAQPTLTLAGNNPTCGNTAATLRATKGLAGYAWTRDGGLLPDAPADSLTVTEPGRYQVAGTSNGCAVQSEELTIEPSFFTRPGALFVPNVFTPDGDVNQANETFMVKNYNGKIRLLVCNRWGKEVYRSNDYRNDWAAAGLPDGMYFYRLTHESGCFSEQRGWVHVLR
jgi:hypothetical protein